MASTSTAQRQSYHRDLALHAAARLSSSVEAVCGGASASAPAVPVPVDAFGPSSSLSGSGSTAYDSSSSFSSSEFTLPSWLPGANLQLDPLPQPELYSSPVSFTSMAANLPVYKPSFASSYPPTDYAASYPPTFSTGLDASHFAPSAAPPLIVPSDFGARSAFGYSLDPQQIALAAMQAGGGILGHIQTAGLGYPSYPYNSRSPTQSASPPTISFSPMTATASGSTFTYRPRAESLNDGTALPSSAFKVAPPKGTGRRRSSAGGAAEWEGIVDKKDRRKIQNRMAQRAYRARLKEQQQAAEAKSAEA